jgi:hypothetical protein
VSLALLLVQLTAWSYCIDCQVHPCLCWLTSAANAPGGGTAQDDLHCSVYRSRLRYLQHYVMKCQLQPALNAGTPAALWQGRGVMFCLFAVNICLQEDGMVRNLQAHCPQRVGLDQQILTLSLTNHHHDSSHRVHIALPADGRRHRYSSRCALRSLSDPSSFLVPHPSRTDTHNGTCNAGQWLCRF